MVLVPQPEEHDRTALLEGPQGRLLGNILAAMGLDDSAVYLSSALPCHTPMADLAAIGASGMDAVLAQGVEEGIEATDVADQVVDAIRTERFWILTHPEMRQAPVERMQRAADQANPG
jgi:hypothetical protein